MADLINQEEWQEWRELRATREIIRRAKEFRLSYILGIGGMPRDNRLETVDSWMGMELIIDMMENIHREGK